MKPEVLFLALSIATLVVALVGAAYSARAYWLKSGTEIRGSYGIASSVAAQDRYVYEVSLANRKDRAVAVFKIFLELDNGYYLEIDDFGHQPLILHPFETVSRKYEPIDQYDVGMRRIRIDGILADRKLRHRLVLSTAEGRYNVARGLDRWDPFSLFFRNYTTAIVHPRRSTFEGKAYGSGTKYVVKFTCKGREDEIVPIYPRDYEVKKFRGFQLTREALESRGALEVFLLEKAVEGQLRCTDLQVFDLDEWHCEAYADANQDVIEATARTWFTYHCLGWIVSRFDDLRLWRENRTNRRNHKERLAAKRHGGSPSV